MQDYTQVVLLQECLLINLIWLVILSVPTITTSRNAPGKVDELMRGIQIYVDQGLQLSLTYLH